KKRADSKVWGIHHSRNRMMMDRFVEPRHFHLFPFFGGTAWFLTLSVLFLYWIAEGRPTYPSQVNPDVA
ncbi:MAG: hypothetical protein Q9174_006945, partial [Haloplaca sp. 1 TL-2023]